MGLSDFSGFNAVMRISMEGASLATPASWVCSDLLACDPQLGRQSRR
jgi:hypothetical protein